MQSEWYDRSTLESILTLPSNIEKVPTEKFQGTAATAIRILFHLATTTDLLGVQYNREWMPDQDILWLMSQKPDVLFAGGLLMKLFLIAEFHKTAVSIMTK